MRDVDVSWDVTYSSQEMDNCSLDSVDVLSLWHDVKCSLDYEMTCSERRDLGWIDSIPDESEDPESSMFGELGRLLGKNVRTSSVV